MCIIINMSWIDKKRELQKNFENWLCYNAFNDQKKIILSDDTANGIGYCFAHHLTIAGDEKKLMVAAIKYIDKFIKIEDK